ncbi:SDR family NAD(P)-dependent oxidoreductase [Saccharospirillum mangrovi]|uniref:SDR family NAD(P)-dependent oxidoreductase n=1 Tax=Saccharospirillum mangrovi TaxID=2161747 RepID=UPI000D360371|nr:SDR family NAD(P)-dependent oxidoreductase [Saccharospirillum mangrovi]
MDINGKRIAITGSSSGIGQALAKALAKQGAEMLIIGRREAAASLTASGINQTGGRAHFVAADITTAAGCASVVAAIQLRLGGLDMLINSAGGVRGGRIEDISESELTQMIEVNTLAPILLTRAVLPMLRQAGAALVVNVASAMGLVGAPFYATYAASKAGIAMFGEALRRELKGEGIGVMTVYPVATDTPMMQSSNAGPELGFHKETVESVVDAIVDGIEQDRLQVVRGGDARLQMIELNRTNPLAIDERFQQLKPTLWEAVQNHKAL